MKEYLLHEHESGTYTVRYFYFPKGGALYKEEGGKTYFYDWLGLVWNNDEEYTIEQLSNFLDDDKQYGVFLTEADVMLLLL